MGASAEMDGIPVEADQLGEAQASLGREQQQGVVATSEPCRPIGRRKDRLDLGACQEMHLPLVVPLAWYREDALNERAVGRLLERHETKEGADGGQTQVARPDAGAAMSGCRRWSSMALAMPVSPSAIRRSWVGCVSTSSPLSSSSLALGYSRAGSARLLGRFPARRPCQAHASGSRRPSRSSSRRCRCRGGRMLPSWRLGSRRDEGVSLQVQMRDRVGNPIPAPR
jgi:hypothetical protein